MIISKISRELGLTRHFVNRVIETASHRYKTYTIPKKTGGVRTIHHPARELKLLQTWLGDNIFSHLDVSQSVFSYKSGVGILDHVKIHRKNNFLMRVDFKDFFPSIKSYDVELLVNKNLEKIPFKLSKADLSIISKVVCRYDREKKYSCLTIGAPSSPTISNAILSEFDAYWTVKCSEMSVSYTRYADDLFFSTNIPDVLQKVYEDIQIYLQAMKSPDITINREKTSFTSRKRKRVITGLVITSESRISIGRSKKRVIKTMCFRYTKSLLDENEISYLRGYLAYLNSVEPSFIKSLESKFGENIINEIRSLVPTSCKYK